MTSAGSLDFNKYITPYTRVKKRKVLTAKINVTLFYHQSIYFASVSFFDLFTLHWTINFKQKIYHKHNDYSERHGSNSRKTYERNYS